MERWAAPAAVSSATASAVSPADSVLTKSTYNTIEDVLDAKEEYEDPDYFYEQKIIAGHVAATQAKYRERRGCPSGVGASPLPPALPPPSSMTLRGTLKSTHLAIHQPRERSRWRGLSVAVVMGAVLLLMLLAVILFLVMGSRAHSSFFAQSRVVASQEANNNNFPPEGEEGASPFMAEKSNMEISPNRLLTLMVTKRKVCLFEASNDDEKSSEESFEDEHIDSARLLSFFNLTHASVPVHPLQFQRYARSLGLDDDCHVVIYDRSQMMWATHAAWIFHLFGARRVSLLSGGLVGWKAAQTRSAQYITERGGSPPLTRQGDFTASWNESSVITFDDVFLNTEISSFDVVDAQSKEEFEGTATGALFGHIRGAYSVPAETLFDWSAGRWLPVSELAQIFRHQGLVQKRPVIVYSSTPVRASMVWWCLTRLGFTARVYFGGWPEWVIRAPDYLKVLAAGQ